MSILYYGNVVSHFENELAYQKFQAMRHPTIQTNNKQNGIDFPLNDAATTVSGKETNTQQNRMDYTLFMGLAIVAVICVIGYYYWNEEQKRKLVEVNSN